MNFASSVALGNFWSPLWLWIPFFLAQSRCFSAPLYNMAR